MTVIMRLSHGFLCVLPFQDGTTSLIAAAQSGNEGMVLLLLEYEADPSAAMQVCIICTSNAWSCYRLSIVSYAINLVNHKYTYIKLRVFESFAFCLYGGNHRPGGIGVSSVRISGGLHVRPCITFHQSGLIRSDHEPPPMRPES